MQKLPDKLSRFFRSSSSFKEEEWVLKYQINTMLLFSFFFGIGVFFFSIFRFVEGNYIVAVSQIIFSTFSLYGFMQLKREKKLYAPYALTFFILFFFYSGILFFYVPQNTLNILWIITAPILIFFFLNKRGGIAMFLLIFGFILYLIASNYPYNNAEFITLLASFFITSYMMYMYEKIKSKEQKRLLLYGQKLEKEVATKTKALQHLNETLEQRIEEEVKRRQTQEQMLYAQNRLANMGMMIDSIAHQWRQPLTHINTILMNISRKAETEPENIEYIDDKVEDIFNITQHMSQTINDFRNLLSPKKEQTTFLLNELIESIFTLMKDMLQEVEIIFNPQEEIYLQSNKNELSQVILIVLQNAIEALKENDIAHKCIEIKLTALKQEVLIEIIDNAKGIPKDKMEQIFNPYFTTKTSKSATGLGLYISKLIMEQSLKGEISFQNTHNGVNFSIVLPLITIVGHNKPI